MESTNKQAYRPTQGGAGLCVDRFKAIVHPTIMTPFCFEEDGTAWEAMHPELRCPPRE